MFRELWNQKKEVSYNYFLELSKIIKLYIFSPYNWDIYEEMKHGVNSVIEKLEA